MSDLKPTNTPEPLPMLAGVPGLPDPDPLYPPLPVFLHSHAPGAVPPGPLEPGIVEIERDGLVLHVIEGLVQPDGSLADFPEHAYEWARQVSYRHLKREGLLETYGVPIVPHYEHVELFEMWEERRLIARRRKEGDQPRKRARKTRG
jgi:hypothetical protein